MHIIIIYNYYISNKGLLKECDKEEHVKVTGVATTSCMKCRGPTRIARLSPDDTTRFTLDVGCRSVSPDEHSCLLCASSLSDKEMSPRC